jgi:TatD DNase family protein
MADYIDIGVNLTGSSFSDDLDDVIARAEAAGVVRMIVTGTDESHSEAALALCRRYPDRLYSTAGVHPHHADAYTQQSAELIRKLCRFDSVVAVGECGLDFNRNYSTPLAQRAAFESQLELAVETGKPVFLHQRDAHDDFVAMLRNATPKLSGAVVHCFTGPAAEAVDYLQLDMYIGITGWICDERRGGELRDAVREIPLDRVLLETDAPYLLPRDLGQKPVQSRRNEPCYLPHICASVARYMNVDEDELAQAALMNTLRLFAIE